MPNLCPLCPETGQPSRGCACSWGSSPSPGGSLPTTHQGQRFAFSTRGGSLCCSCPAPSSSSLGWGVAAGAAHPRSPPRLEPLLHTLLKEK